MKFSAHPLSPPIDLPSVGIDQALMERLRFSFAAFEPLGERFSAIFYDKLFAAHPQLRALFPADMAAQRKKLFATLQWVIDHLEDGDRLRAAIRDLGRRHEAYHARPEHYPMVTAMLLSAMREAAASEWDDAIEADWRTALDLIARLMLGRA